MRTLVVELPEEFIALCNRDNLKDYEIIRDFIADLCGIVPWKGAPRSDGYSSTGCDGRNLAWEYYEAVGFSSRNPRQS